MHSSPAYSNSVRRRLLLAGLAALALQLATAYAYYPEWVEKNTVLNRFSFGLRSGDVNGDGRPDLLVRASSIDIRLVITPADGTLGAGTIVYQGTNISDELLADVNGDGHLDILLAETATNSLVALPGNGDGTFGTPVITPLPIVPTQIAAIDFNGDQHPEILVRSSSGPSIAVYGSDGAFQFSQLSTVALDSSPYGIALGDLDGDGKNDVVIGCLDPVGYKIYFGKGDATFDPPVSAASPPANSASAFVVADLNADGKAEIVATSYSADTVSVMVNLGNRTFASPVSYATNLNATTTGRPRALAVIDATDDGKPDVVVILGNLAGVATLPGNGDGSLQSAVFSSTPVLGPTTMVAADFTGDGRPDVVVGGAFPNGAITLLRNAPGELNLTPLAKYPTLTLGQSDTLTATTYLSGSYLYNAPSPPPSPTGNVTFREGDTAIGSASLQTTFSGTSASFDTSSLPLGAQVLTASYDGDSNYRAAASPSFGVNVVTETTTVTLSKNYPPGDPQYGESMGWKGDASSPIAGSLDGLFFFYIDGQRSVYASSGPPTYWYPEGVLPGTHTFQVTYEGNATHPPGKSPIVTQLITKGDTIFSVFGSSFTVKYGDQPSIEMDLRETAGNLTTGGNVHLYEGNTLLATMFAASIFDFHFPVLPIGVHYLYVKYDGTANFNPSQSQVLKYTVLPNTPMAIQALATNGNSITVFWSFTGPNDGHNYYLLYRRLNSDPWSVTSLSDSYTNWSEYNPVPGNVYTYRMEVYNGSNQLLATSNIDSATLTAFTDDPVLQSTPVKAVHLTELVGAVNVYRAAAGLQPIAFAEIAPGGAIRAFHITALQDGLNQARAVLGSDQVVFTGGATPGAPIKAQHVQDLREAIR